MSCPLFLRQIDKNFSVDKIFLNVAQEANYFA